MNFISTYAKMCEAAVKPLSKIGITPSTITMLSLFLGLISGFLIYRGNFIAALVFLLFSGIFDSFDGALARVSGRTTKFGAVLDSTVDRIVEFSIVMGIFLFISHTSPQNTLKAAVLSMIAYSASVWVSYVKARAEGVGVSPAVGILQRRHRIALLSLALLLSAILKNCAVTTFFYLFYILTAGCMITLFQRLVRTKKLLQ